MKEITVFADFDFLTAPQKIGLWVMSAYGATTISLSGIPVTG